MGIALSPKGHSDKGQKMRLTHAEPDLVEIAGSAAVVRIRQDEEADSPILVDLIMQHNADRHFTKRLHMTPEDLQLAFGCGARGTDRHARSDGLYLRDDNWLTMPRAISETEYEADAITIELDARIREAVREHILASRLLRPAKAG